MRDDVLVTKEFLDNINNRINETIKISSDKAINEKLNGIIKYIQENIDVKGYDSEKLANLIKLKMKEVRSIDPDLETRYYMLHQDLINNRIALEKAEDLYKMYENLQEYEKRIY